MGEGCALGTAGLEVTSHKQALRILFGGYAISINYEVEARRTGYLSTLNDGI